MGDVTLVTASIRSMLVSLGEVGCCGSSGLSNISLKVSEVGKPIEVKEELQGGRGVVTAVALCLVRT